MKVTVLKPFPYKGKTLQVGSEVTLSKEAYALWSNIDHVAASKDEAKEEELKAATKEAPTKEAKK